MSISDVARAFFAPAGPVLKFGLGLDGVGTWSGVPGGAPNYPNGCQVCEVEVDPETGTVRIDRFAAVDDLGMVINPMICEGQIHGGIAQGVGQALFENIVYDDKSGQLITGSFLDYGMPRADDFPSFHLRARRNSGQDQPARHQRHRRSRNDRCATDGGQCRARCAE